MSNFLVFRASLLTLLTRIGRVGIGIFALSMVLGALTPIPISFASPHTFSRRVQIDANVVKFQALSPTEAVVLDNSRRLWLERAPFGSVPPTRTQIDVSVSAFQALSDTEILVLQCAPSEVGCPLFLDSGPSFASRAVVDTEVNLFQALSDTQILVQRVDSGDLFLNRAPFGRSPDRTPIDTNVLNFQALSATEVLVVNNNSTTLWLEHGPFVGRIPPARTLVDTNVAPFPIKALSTTEILANTSIGLALEHAPFGNAARTLIDRNVLNFEALSSTQILVEGTDSKLWLERAPFGSVPPARAQIDANVSQFQAVPGTNTSQVMVLGTDHKLWLEFAPF